MGGIVSRSSSWFSRKDVELKKIKETITTINKKLVELNEVKILVDTKNKLELDKDRLEVEIGGLRNQLVSKKSDLAKYNANLDAIEFNKKVDIDLSIIKTNIVVFEHTKDDTLSKIQRVTTDVQTNKRNNRRRTNNYNIQIKML